MGREALEARLGGLTPHDREEVWLFYDFLRTIGDNPHRDPHEVYDEVYSKRTPH